MRDNYFETVFPQDLKIGDKIIFCCKKYIVSTKYVQGCGMGNFDFGEYGVIDAVSDCCRPGYVRNKLEQLTLFENLPIIRYTEKQ